VRWTHPAGRRPAGRYLDVVPLPAGGWRIYCEERLDDESHELRTELVPPCA
jgi:hypothetical protein